ncbi:hypothetical protein R1flu_010306 [Riccia fluitans]|uniref:Reverse transcriptase zinc-binding domain-containing protein n=1 Tax=Riccia fluitans TaxID=41844 RepID=A0ABD1Z4L9_9MARC
MPLSFGEWYGKAATKAQRFGFGDGRCPVCKLQKETIDHLFLKCPNLRGFWKTLHKDKLTPFGKWGKQIYLRCEVAGPLALKHRSIRNYITFREFADHRLCACCPLPPSDTGPLGYEAAEDPFRSHKFPHDAILEIGKDRSLAHPSSPPYTPRRILTKKDEGVHTSDFTLAPWSNAGGTRSSPLSNLPACSPLFALNTEHETGEIRSIVFASLSSPPRANSTKATAPTLAPGSTRNAQSFTGGSRPATIADFTACPSTEEQENERVIREPQMGIRRDAGGIQEIVITHFTHANSMRTKAMFPPPPIPLPKQDLTRKFTH